LPRLSVWFARTALVHLVAGFTLGALLLTHKGVPLHPALWRLLPAHIELLLLGWTLNLALGVAYWILPRFKTGAPRGPAWPVWAAYGLLNGGIGLVCAAAWVPGGAILLLLGRTAEAIAAGLFAWHARPRLKAPGA
jgi:hypothetical protein